MDRDVIVADGAGAEVLGTLTLPREPRGLVIFAHGSGSSRFSSRNRFVARVLNEGAFGTLLMDLLTPAEDRIDQRTAEHRFDIPLLAQRLVASTDAARDWKETRALPLGYFGASTGAAAALVAAARKPDDVAAVVSRGGRPDLAGDALPAVRAPTLLIVGGADPVVLELNHAAKSRLHAPAEFVVVPGATHLFEEPGALETVSRFARDWFSRHLGRP